MGKTVVFGGMLAGVSVLALIGLFTPGRNMDAVKELADAAVADTATQVQALEARLDSVEAGSAELSAQVSALEGELADAQSRLQDLTQASAGTADLASQLSAMESRLAGAEAAAETAVASVEEVAKRAAPVVSGAESSGGAPKGAVINVDAAGVSPGETAVFADGGLRIFISRLMPEDEAIRVSVAREMKELSLGQRQIFAVGEEYCGVTLDGFNAEGAVLTALCGDDLPAPAGVRAGETAVLLDGALRVFASRVEEDAAQISVSGNLMTLDVGRSVPVTGKDGPCRVSLEAVDRGHMTVSAVCDASLALSEPVAPGSTVVLGDGAARVFVASIQDDSALRVAINGQKVVSGEVRDLFPTSETCGVQVEEIDDGAATFSYLCAE